MRRIIIAVVKPQLVRGGAPTLLTRNLVKTHRGRLILKHMLTFYVSTPPVYPYKEMKLNTDLNIEDYRIVFESNEKE